MPLILMVINYWVIPTIIIAFFVNWIIFKDEKTLIKVIISLLNVLISFIIYVFLQKGLVEIILLSELHLPVYAEIIVQIMIMISAVGIPAKLLMAAMVLPPTPSLFESIKDLKKNNFLYRVHLSVPCLIF